MKDAWRDARVIALDNLKRRGSELNLPRLREGRVEFIHGDIRNASDLDAAGAVGCVIECSAEPSVLAGYSDAPSYVVDTNLTGAVNCFEYARHHGASVLFISTSRVYPIAQLNAIRLKEGGSRFEFGQDGGVPGISKEGIAEQFPLEGARSLYGATKLCAELILAEYRSMYGIKAVVNRCGLVAGPWQMGKADQGVVVLWAARHLWGGELEYIGYGGAGKQVRDVLHVEDLTRLIVYELGHLDELDGELFNVGGGTLGSVSLSELTALCQRVTGQKLHIGQRHETRAGDVPWYVTDNRRVMERTGWCLEKGIETVVKDIVEWLQREERSVRPIVGK